MHKFTKSSLILVASLLTACATTPSETAKDTAKKKKVAELNIEMGMSYLEERDVQHAKQKFLQALRTDPDLPEANYSIAYFFEMTGEKTMADDYYLKAIALAPQRGDSQNNYGTFLCRTGHYRQSIEHFMIAVQNPSYLDTAGAYENAGLCAAKIPDTKQAITYFNHAIAQDAERPVSLITLAEIYYKLKNYPAAEQKLQQYLAIAPATAQSDALAAHLRKT